MTIALSELTRLLPDDFVEVITVAETVIRSTRRLGTNPYAIYYFDVGNELPTTEEDLADYQERVIGPNYFKGLKSLQWNNYLYFVTNQERLRTGEIDEAKQLIEADRNYARKYIISEEQIETLFSPIAIAPKVDPARESVQAQWLTKLSEAGIEDAILGQYYLPERLAKIDDSAPPPVRRRRSPQRAAVPLEQAIGISEIDLGSFRQYPMVRKFHFGKVNLIFGANGSGKTSLLEAIELYYCGRNKRTPNIQSPYELRVVLTDGRDDMVTEKREPQLFRDRNLVWYGQAEMNTNNLYQNFAQYNFLNTDAAVHLTASGKEIEDDLTKLLIGPDAATVWGTIELVWEALTERLANIHERATEWSSQLATVETKLSEPANALSESESIRAQLKTMLARNNWSQLDSATSGSQILMNGLPEFVVLTKQITALPWMNQPTTMTELERSIDSGRLIADSYPDHIALLVQLEADEASSEQGIQQSRQILELLVKLDQLIDAGVLDRNQERERLLSVVARSTRLVAQAPLDVMSSLRAESARQIDVLQQSAQAERVAAGAAKQEIEEEREKMRSLADRSDALTQELRELATTIIQSSSMPDECPVCHTRFEPGQLRQHMTAGIDAHLEALARTATAHLAEADVHLEQAVALDRASTWLAEFCGQSNLDRNTTVGVALEMFDEIRENLTNTQSRLETLGQQDTATSEQGFSPDALQAVHEGLDRLGQPTGDLSKESVNDRREIIEKGVEDDSQRLTEIHEQMAEVNQWLETTLGPASDADGFKLRWSQFEDRVARTVALVDKIHAYSPRFGWPAERSITELSIEVELLQQLVGQMGRAQESEQNASLAHGELSEQKASLEERLEASKNQLMTLERAHRALTEIRTEYPLDEALEQTLEQNRQAIDSIFKRIHAPAEFKGLGRTLTTLVKEPGGEVELNEISTGQRAAFALSLFLAQNGALVNAPPVVLIDDPIAHIDDLNTLAFLDYLREVVLQGTRQIFFATASGRVAALFERKFDFLGPDEFRRIDLTR